jgi:hypothetical protein
VTGTRHAGRPSHSQGAGASSAHGKTTTPGAAPLNPDTMEVAPGTIREAVQGWTVEFGPGLASEEEKREAIEKAFDYRGDVTLTLKDGSKVEGYLFDRTSGATAATSFVRLIPANSEQRQRIAYADIAALAFTGRDTAAGKSWEAWVRKYWEKKTAGEKGTSLEPEALG